MANANRRDDKLMNNDLNKLRDPVIPRGAGGSGKSSGSRGSSKGSKGAGSRLQTSKNKQKNR